MQSKYYYLIEQDGFVEKKDDIVYYSSYKKRIYLKDIEEMLKNWKDLKKNKVFHDMFAFENEDIKIEVRLFSEPYFSIDPNASKFKDINEYKNTVRVLLVRIKNEKRGTQIMNSVCKKFNFKNVINPY